MREGRKVRRGRKEKEGGNVLETALVVIDGELSCGRWVSRNYFRWLVSIRLLKRHASEIAWTCITVICACDDN